MIAVHVAAAVASVLALLALPTTGPGDQVSGTRAKATVARIASLGPRPAGSANERKAGRIVAERLRDLGYAVEMQRFRLPQGGRSRNVVGVSGEPVRAVVVAHLDGVRRTPAANDNASGVAVMLEVARALRDEPGLLVAALGAEEREETRSSLHLGSARLVRSFSRAERRAIRVAISLDMVGVGTRLYVGGVEARPNRSARLTLRRARALRLRPRYLPRVSVSDHAELTRGGVPAAWITWRWDRCWHRPCDRPRRVKAWKLQPVARVTAAAVRAALSR